MQENPVIEWSSPQVVCTLIVGAMWKVQSPPRPRPYLVLSSHVTWLVCLDATNSYHLSYLKFTSSEANIHIRIQIILNLFY